MVKASEVEAGAVGRGVGGGGRFLGQRAGDQGRTGGEWTGAPKKRAAINSWVVTVGGCVVGRRGGEELTAGAVSVCLGLNGVVVVLAGRLAVGR